MTVCTMAMLVIYQEYRSLPVAVYLSQVNMQTQPLKEGFEEYSHDAKV